MQAISGEWRPGVYTGELTAHRSLYKPLSLGHSVCKMQYLACAERLLQKKKKKKSSGSSVQRWLWFSSLQGSYTVVIQAGMEEKNNLPCGAMKFC